MLHSSQRLVLITCFFLGLFLLHVKRTSADLTAQRTVKNNKLRATTLDIAEQHTANFTSITTLFNTVGYLPEGFDIKAMKLIKKGELNFNYQLKIERQDDSSPLCQNFLVRVLKNWVEIYNGPLLNFTIEAKIGDSGADDWIFILTFPGGGEELKNSTCAFKLTTRTYRNNANEPMAGLWANETLMNIVTTGNW